MKTLFIDMLLNRNRIQTIGETIKVPQTILEPPVEVLGRRFPESGSVILLIIRDSVSPLSDEAPSLECVDPPPTTLQNKENVVFVYFI